MTNPPDIDRGVLRTLLTDAVTGALARGGLDFIIGDGRINYDPEKVWESYYSCRVFRGLFASYDLQRIANPVFNRDRGPVWVSSLRLHLEYGR